jgi:HD-GYP domain-containing protein (c-di-GMP phosphodiesterase class II)
MNDKYKIIYKDLLALVHYSIDAKIEEEKITKSIEALVDIFQEQPYNDLMLLIYGNSKDNYIYAHIANNVILSIAFATSLKLPRQDIIDVGLCAFGHDFGMTEYLDLFRKPAQLTQEESQSIQNHPLKSAAIFKDHFSERVIEGMLDIHEHVNGKGYPKGKSGTDISFLARIVSICDIYEALTHARNFRTEFTPYTAIKMVIKKKDLVFERKVVKKFVEFMSIYPIGSLVNINTGEKGLVIAATPQFPTRSIVRVLLAEKNEIQFTGKVVDLSADHMLYISGPADPKEEKEVLMSITEHL